MTKDFDLTSPKWLELVFDKKNKRYGAYAIRNDSSNRHIKSLIIVTIVALLALFLPRIIENMVLRGNDTVQQVAVDQTNFQTNEKPQETQEQPVEQIVTPPPSLRQTAQFTEAVIDKDENIQAQNYQKANEILADLDADLGAQNVEGVTQGGSFSDKVEEQQSITDEAKNKIYSFVEKSASFPGGEDALTKWLNENIQYPYAAQEAGISGRVVVAFVVERDGSISNLKILHSIHSSLDKEALRLVKMMPKWIPGKQNGVAVRMFYQMPINFILK